MSGRLGFTLVEVVVASLVVLVAISGLLSVALTGRQSVGRGARRAAAVQALRRISETLKVYRTASTTVARGPGEGPDGWRLTGDSCACAAFAPGRHRLDVGIWAPELKEAKAEFSYTVTSVGTALGERPEVAFVLNWVER